MLKAGDRVKVFQQPMAREDFEGVATILEMENSIGFWDDTEYFRAILRIVITDLRLSTGKTPSYEEISSRLQSLKLYGGK